MKLRLSKLAPSAKQDYEGGTTGISSGDKASQKCSAPDLRKMHRSFHQAHQSAFNAWMASDHQTPLVLPTFPELLRGLPCGAKTRSGTPCKLTSIYSNGRCKLHGGLSTGPTTQEGKARAAANGNAPKRERTP
jgi:hypothetical protein